MKNLRNTALLLTTLLVCFNTFAQNNTEWNSKNSTKWVKSREWANGVNINPHNSTNNVEFAAQYHKNKELWDKTFQFLNEKDLAKIEAGKYIIEEGKCWITVSEYLPKEPSEGNIEQHQKFIDLQYTLSGDEYMGLAPVNSDVRTPYSEQKDVGFYSSAKVKYYKTTPDKFFLFFPSDIHQPSVKAGVKTLSRKIVAKIEYVK